jgi:hypothetical protein
MALDLFSWKNEAIMLDRAQRHQTPVHSGRLPGKASAPMTYQDFGCVPKFAVFLAAALGLDFAHLFQGFLELAGQFVGHADRGWRGRGGPLGVFAIDGGAALAPTKDRVSCDGGRDDSDAEDMIGYLGHRITPWAVISRAGLFDVVERQGTIDGPVGWLGLVTGQSGIGGLAVIRPSASPSGHFLQAIIYFIVY